MRAITCPHGIKPKSKCKQCLKLQKASSYQRTKKHVLAHMKDYRQANLERERQQDRKNLAPACSTCNRKKGNKTAYEFTGRNYVAAT